MKRWQTSTMRGIGASSGVTRSRDPLPGDEDFKTCRAGDLSWDRGQCEHGWGALICQKRGEGLGKSRGNWNQRLGRVCLPSRERWHGLWMPSLMRISKGSEQAMCLQCGEKVSSAAAERQGWKTESSSMQAERWKSFGWTRWKARQVL